MIPIETPTQILAELNIRGEENKRTQTTTTTMLLCIVRDMNDGARKVSIDLPAASTCESLLTRVASRLTYTPSTFLLYYEEPDDAEKTENGICVNDHLQSALCNIVGHGTRHNFYLTAKNGEDIQKCDAATSTSNMAADDIIRNTTTTTTSSSEMRSTGGAATITNDTTSTSDFGNIHDNNKSSYGNYGLNSILMKSETGFVGLVNQAMTCYLNSLLQTLYMTPEFRNAVYRWEYDGTDDEAVKSIPYQLQKLFLMLQTSDKKSVGTTDITKSFGWDSSDAWHQHDIQELCRVMFDALEKTWQNTEQADLINQLYQGKMKDCVQCLQCGWESARIVAYQDIPLAVKPFGEGKAYTSIEESLRAFCAHELLDGNNQWFCEKCAIKVDAHKSLKFITFPYLLTMHLMRFDFDYSTLRRIKLNHRVGFPLSLDLNEFVVNSDLDLSSSDSQAQNGVVVNGVNKGVDEMEVVDGAISQNSNSTNAYEYELFSIMVHSGNASGGHYYAYIKSFEGINWFSFNDQHVTTITHDDIKKTFGGTSSVHGGHYSSSFASSTNAYMLMYRQIDEERNAKFTQVDQFTPHLQRELKKMQDREDNERRQQETERNTCKIKLFTFHPIEQKFIETTFAIHMNKTLSQATKIAWKLFELEGVVPFDCVRLVKYDSLHEYIDRSFDDDDDETPMHKVLGGVKFFYGFDLLLELKRPDQEFVVYRTGGISVKVYVVDLATETISFPLTIRASLSQTVGDLKDVVATELTALSNDLRCVVETHSDLKMLADNARLLKSEGFNKSNKMFVEYSGTEDDTKTDFRKSRLFDIIDRFENTIRIHIHLPIFSSDIEINPSINDSNDDILPTLSSSLENLRLSVKSNSLVCAESSFSMGLTSASPASDTTSSSSSSLPSNVAAASYDNDARRVEKSVDSAARDSVNPVRRDDDDSTDPVDRDDTVATNGQIEKMSQAESGVEMRTNVCAGEATFDVATVNDVVKCDDADKDSKSQQRDNDRGDWVNSGSSGAEENSYRRYFRATIQINAETKDRNLTVALDKRITLESLKICLESYVGTTSANFELFRITSSGEELEMKRLTESLNMYDDDCQFKVKLGRPLQKGEQRVKVHQLLINDSEPIKFLCEVIVSKGMTVLQAKQSFFNELKQKQILDGLSTERCRVRKKCWKNPGNVYCDTQAFDGQDICLVPNMDLLIEILLEPDQLRLDHEEQLSIYARRWHPAKYQLGEIVEIIVEEEAPNDLIKKISNISRINEENVQFSKISGVFPFDMSVFEIHSGIVWGPRENNTCTTLKTLSVYSDGAMFFYRDKTEVLKMLTNEEKKEIQQNENSRFFPTSSSFASSRRKERALKIYTDEAPKSAVVGSN